ncbi:MAG: hypothetical protein Q8K45_05870 [Rubrivivax sp.]|nr:hypothetical protein [Rubrivivax sp.]
MPSFPFVAPLATLALALACTLAGCSTQSAYTMAMELRKQECRKLPDLAERARCEKEADRSHERYQSEAEAARRKP